MSRKMTRDEFAESMRANGRPESEVCEFIVEYDRRAARAAAGGNSTRAQVLDEARALITGDRNKAYGEPRKNFANTADLWTTQFAHLLKDDAKFTASHIAQAMILLKMARMIASKKRDNWVDAAGFAGCGAECDEDEA